MVDGFWQSTLPLLSKNELPSRTNAQEANDFGLVFAVPCDRRMQISTLQELAETYERWAADAEALANRIRTLSSQSQQAQLRQQPSVETLLEEAQRLRLQADRLRQNPGPPERYLR